MRLIVFRDKHSQRKPARLASATAFQCSDQRSPSLRAACALLLMFCAALLASVSTAAESGQAAKHSKWMLSENAAAFEPSQFDGEQFGIRHNEPPHPIDLRDSLRSAGMQVPDDHASPATGADLAKGFSPGDARWSDQYALGIGCNGPIYAITRGADGAYFVGGRFTTCGDVIASNVARFDPITRRWSALISPVTNGVNGEVRSLLLWSGSLYVAGSIYFGQSQTGGSIGRHVVRWDGSQWHGMGIQDVYGDARSLAVVGGQLYAGGYFELPSNMGSNIDGVLRWTGSTWVRLGVGEAGTLSNTVYAITEFNGQLVAAGLFGYGGDGPTAINLFRIARWTGSQWMALGSNGGYGLSSWVTSLAVWNGSLYVGGNFTSANAGGGQIQVPASRIARWDGSNWFALGSGVDGRVESMLAMGDKLYVGGRFAAAGGDAAAGFASWNGSTWQALANGLAGSTQYENIPSVFAIASGEVGLLVGGDFGRFATASPAAAPSVVVNNIAELASQLVLPLGTPSGDGVNGWVTSLARFRGDLYIAGQFSAVGGVAVNNIARFDGEQWQPVGSGAGNGVDNLIYTLTASDDNLFVGGKFRTANLGGASIAANLVARWDGNSWHGLGLNVPSGVDYWVEDVLWSSPHLYAAGAFAVADAVNPSMTAKNIARWNGSQWLALGSGEIVGVTGIAHSLAKIGDNLYVGGRFLSVIEGEFSSQGTTVNSLARWNGSSWSAVGTDGGAGVGDGPILQPTVYSLSVVGTDLYVGGRFFTVNAGGANPISAQALARWDGGAWHAVGSGSNAGPNYDVFDIRGHEGMLFIAGYFDRITNGNVSQPIGKLAKWDGQSWSSIGSGIGVGNNAYAYALLPDEFGGMYVGGGFGTAGGKPSSNLARFDLTDYSIFSSGFELP